MEQKLSKILDGTEYDCDDYPEGENMCKASNVWAELYNAYIVVDGETKEIENFDIASGDTLYLVFEAFWSPQDTGELTNGKVISSKVNVSFDLKQAIN